MKRTTITIALCASAVAGAMLGATPIGHAAARVIIPNASVGTVQLKANAITSVKVKDGTLLAKDFKAGQLPAVQKGAQGAQGPQGQQGPQGPPGPAGTIQNAAAGGDLTGTFPNPKLAAASVDGAAVADRSLRLTDLAVANGQVHVDLPSIGGGSCINRLVPIAGRQARDILVLQPTGNLPAGLMLMPIFDVNDGGSFTIRVCNITGSALDALDGNWGYAVFR